ncbi:MAG TPA: four helix bundle protein [Flavisolibacter sp.]|jgi:four helix bundle protein
MKNFKQLRVWQNGMKIAVNAFRLVQTFPKEERFGLASQITRAGVSIPSNIAEGSSRSSEKDYCRFIEISLGSSFELDTHRSYFRGAWLWKPGAEKHAPGRHRAGEHHATQLSVHLTK